MKLLTSCTCTEPDGWTPDLLDRWRKERNLGGYARAYKTFPYEATILLNNQIVTITVTGPTEATIPCSNPPYLKWNLTSSPVWFGQLTNITP